MAVYQLLQQEARFSLTKAAERNAESEEGETTTLIGAERMKRHEADVENDTRSERKERRDTSTCTDGLETAESWSLDGKQAQFKVTSNQV